MATKLMGAVWDQRQKQREQRNSDNARERRYGAYPVDCALCGMKSRVINYKKGQITFSMVKCRWCDNRGERCATAEEAVQAWNKQNEKE